MKKEQYPHNLPFSFLLLVAALFIISFLPTESPSEVNTLQDSSKLIAEQLTEMNNAPIKNGRVDLAVLEDLASKDVEEVREILGFDGKFCIAIEDNKGRLIPLAGRAGIGNNRLLVSGVPCGQEILP